MGQSGPLSNQRVMDSRVGLQDALSRFECIFWETCYARFFTVGNRQIICFVGLVGEPL